jgi:hypothetical protein
MSSREWPGAVRGESISAEQDHIRDRFSSETSKRVAPRSSERMTGREKSVVPAPARARFPAELLASHAGLRQAILLIEILGPPKALRPDDHPLWQQGI